MADPNKLCTCITAKTFKHRAGMCAFGVLDKPKRTNQTKPPPSTKTVEATIDKFVADAYAPIKSFFGAPATANLTKKGSTEEAKKSQKNTPSTASPATPASPTSTGDLSPSSGLSAQSIATELPSADYAQTCDSAEDSLEPTMPCLPSMSTPGVFIPALHIRVPENFVNIDAEWSVATGGAAVIDGVQTPHQGPNTESHEITRCDTTHVTSTETVAAEAEIDLVSTHEQTTQHTVLTSADHLPSSRITQQEFDELMAVLEQTQEKLNNDEFTCVDSEGEGEGGSVGGEEGDRDSGGVSGGDSGKVGGIKCDMYSEFDEVSELGNTYFGESYPQPVLCELDSVALAEENQRLKAEMYLFKSQCSLSAVYKQQDEQYSLDHPAPSTADHAWY